MDLVGWIFEQINAYSYKLTKGNYMLVVKTVSHPDYGPITVIDILTGDHCFLTSRNTLQEAFDFININGG